MQLDSYQNKAIDILLSLPQEEKKYLSFSGGKDSTALLGLALLASKEGFTNWEVNHSDTLMEIPMMDAHIKACMTLCESNRIKFNYLIPPVEDRFFIRMIGRGIPTPNRNFRWCTDNLKIKPQETYVKEEQEIKELRRGKKKTYNRFIVITGERLGESSKRDIKLKGECSSNNECGVTDIKTNDVFKQISRPLLNMSTCQVWDTLALLDISEIVPDCFNILENIYSISEQTSKDSLRTGCIGCPLINKDQSLERFANAYPGYSPLKQLGSVYASFGIPENRIMRPDGKGKGAVLLSHRKAMYEQILQIEAEVQTRYPDFVLIHQEEKDAINQALAEQRYPKGYSREYLLSVGAID